MRTAAGGTEGAGRTAGDEGTSAARLVVRLARALEVPLRLRVEGPEGDERVVHDGLPAGGDGREPRRRRLPLSRRRTAVLETAPGDGEEDRADLLVEVAGRLLGRAEESRLFARELEDRYEEISLLTSIGETLASVLELGRAADRLLAELVEVTGAARATLWLHEPGDEHLRLLASRGVSEPGGRRVELGAEDSLVAEVFRAQQARLVDPADGAGRRWPGYGDAALLAVPASYAPGDGDRRRVGVLVLVGRPEGGRFSAGDRDLVEAVASQAAAAVENRRLVRESLQRERLSAELELAHDLQLALLPDPSSVDDLAEAAARCEPARSVGGDFYHLIRLSDRRLGVLIGDVSSHGISAALLMARALSAAGLVAREEEGPAAVLSRLEGELAQGMGAAEMYVTLFYAVLEGPAGRMRYASAGHPHAHLLGGDGPRRLPATDPPLGLREAGGRFGERTVETGDPPRPLLLFTDGLFEPAAGGRRAAEALLADAADAAAAEGMEAAVEAVFRTSDALAGGGGDDRTALAVRPRGGPR